MNSTPSWRVEYCLSGIRCVRTSVVTAIAVISVLSVYNLLSLHPRRPTAQLLTYNKFLNSDHANAHNQHQSNLPKVGKTRFTTQSHKSTKHPIRLKARTKHRKETAKSISNPSGARLLYSERKNAEGKMIVWHMIPKYRKPEPDKVQECGKYKCVISTNKSRIATADAVIVDVFLLSRNRFKDKPIRTSPNQVFIFFAKEPWANYEELFPKSWDAVFNWTMTYQKDSEYFTPYGEVVPKNKDSKETFDWDKIMKMKTKSVFWLVSNCNAGSLRQIYVDELRKHIDVDIVGKCGRRKCMENGTKGNVDPCYQQSRFYLAFESRHCQDYVTEKFFRTFNHHIIPVVRGKANYSSLCPSDLYINTADFESPKKLAQYLKYLESNSTAYLGYLKRRAQYRAVSRGNRMCEICSSLHQLDKYRKSYPSISEWIGRCETPAQPHLH